MKRKQVLIIGATSGIGKVVCQKMANMGFSILAVGRKKEKLLILKKNPNISTYQADLSDREQLMDFISYINSFKNKFDYVIYSAAESILLKLKDIDYENWDKNLKINLEMPALLTVKCKDAFSYKCRVLFISSGLASRSLESLSLYCISKAALKMLYNCFKVESRDFQCLFGYLELGAVDTSMQEKIRAYDTDYYPVVNHFKALMDKGELLCSNEVADKILELLLNFSDQEFSTHKWSYSLKSKPSFYRIPEDF